MRNSTIFLIHIAVLGTGLALMVMVGPHQGSPSHEAIVEKNAMLVKQLGLTDLCLFNEARYTRHLSQADLFSAFQESPLAFEHYPSGSMTLPPAALNHGAAGGGER